MDVNRDTGTLLAEGQIKILKSKDGHQAVEVKIVNLTLAYFGFCQVQILNCVEPGEPNGYKPGMTLDVFVEDLVDKL